MHGLLIFDERELHIKTSKTENVCLAVNSVALEWSLKEVNVIST